MHLFFLVPRAWIINILCGLSETCGSLLVSYAYVAIESIDCILLSLSAQNVILLTSSVNSPCFSILNLCYEFNINLLGFFLILWDYLWDYPTHFFVSFFFLIHLSLMQLLFWFFHLVNDLSFLFIIWSTKSFSVST